MLAMTDAATRPRRGRPPKVEAQLTREAIRVAALAVIDDEGSAAVSMRSVSRRLGVDAKSLYHHVEGKDDLLDAVAEYVLGQLNTPTLTGRLDVDLAALAHEFRRVTLAHPDAATLVLTRQMTSLTGLGPVEAVLSVLRRAGASPAQAVGLMRVLLATLIGTLLREVAAAPTFGSADVDAIEERRRDLEQSGLAEVAAAAPHLARFDREREFATMIDSMVAMVTVTLNDAGG